MDDIKEKILKIAQKKKKFKAIEIAKSFGISRQYISLVLSELVNENKLVRGGLTNLAFYALPENASFLGKIFHKAYQNKDLKEHEVLDEINHQAYFLNKNRENIKSIFAYAFTEMLNNAIEHSKSSSISIKISESDKLLTFIVRDFGIGVFRNVMEKRGLKNELEAIQDLLKGKTTTAPQAHSGEGIFFTSKIADIFVLESFNFRLRVDNTIPDVFIEEIKKPLEGTKVTFNIASDSKKHLSDVFRKFQTSSGELAFDKTEIQVKLYTMGTIYISRSQARRVLTGLEKFKSVILDFDKVPTVGQAFADEIFRVFKAKHPEISIKPVNMNETVAFMVGRVEKPPTLEPGSRSNR